jgi:biotin carboxyl carrier protein
MRTYRVKVNGKVYEVELEEVVKKDDSIKLSSKKEVKAKEDSGVKIQSFMQGTIVDVKVKVGQEVIEGQTLAILEAMKMENEIVSPVNGVVNKVYIQKQDVVENQEVLMIIN